MICWTRLNDSVSMNTICHLKFEAKKINDSFDELAAPLPKRKRLSKPKKLFDCIPLEQ